MLISQKSVFSIRISEEVHRLLAHKLFFSTQPNTAYWEWLYCRFTESWMERWCLKTKDLIRYKFQISPLWSLAKHLSSIFLVWVNVGLPGLLAYFRHRGLGQKVSMTPHYTATIIWGKRAHPEMDSELFVNSNHRHDTYYQYSQKC